MTKTSKPCPIHHAPADWMRSHMTYRLFFETDEDAAKSVKLLREDGWLVRQLDLTTMSVYATIPGALQKIFQNGLLPWSTFQELIGQEYKAIDYVQVAYAQAAELVI